MNEQTILELQEDLHTTFADVNVATRLSYSTQFVSNDAKAGKKVLATIEEELEKCDSFKISVAFITMSGITPLIQTLTELEEKGIKGEILTTNYLTFTEPKALERLSRFKNIDLKIFDVDAAGTGFHTKGYIFQKHEIYRVIIGSSNLTSAALTLNREWNTKLVSTEQGEIVNDILAEFTELWESDYSLGYSDFIDDYKNKI